MLSPSSPHKLMIRELDNNGTTWHLTCFCIDLFICEQCCPFLLFFIFFSKIFLLFVLNFLVFFFFFSFSSCWRGRKLFHSFFFAYLEKKNSFPFLPHLKINGLAGFRFCAHKCGISYCAFFHCYTTLLHFFVKKKNNFGTVKFWKKNSGSSLREILLSGNLKRFFRSLWQILPPPHSPS